MNIHKMIRITSLLTLLLGITGFREIYFDSCNTDMTLNDSIHSAAEFTTCDGTSDNDKTVGSLAFDSFNSSTDDSLNNTECVIKSLNRGDSAHYDLVFNNDQLEKVVFTKSGFSQKIYYYYNENRISKVIYDYGNGSEVRKNAITYKYDPNGKLTQKVIYEMDDAENVILRADSIIFTYDSPNIINGISFKWNYSYHVVDTLKVMLVMDKLGNLIKEYKSHYKITRYPGFRYPLNRDTLILFAEFDYYHDKNIDEIFIYNAPILEWNYEGIEFQNFFAKNLIKNITTYQSHKSIFFQKAQINYEFHQNGSVLKLNSTITNQNNKISKKTLAIKYNCD